MSSYPYIPWYCTVAVCTLHAPVQGSGCVNRYLAATIPYQRCNLLLSNQQSLELQVWSRRIARVFLITNSISRVIPYMPSPGHYQAFASANETVDATATALPLSYAIHLFHSCYDTSSEVYEAYTPNREPDAYKSLHDPPSITCPFASSSAPSPRYHFYSRAKPPRTNPTRHYRIGNLPDYLPTFAKSPPQHLNMCTLWIHSFSYCSHIKEELSECAGKRAGKCPNPNSPTTRSHPNDGDCGCGASRRGYR